MKKPKSRFRKQLELKAGLWALRLFRAVFALLSLGFASRIGAAIGSLAYRLLHKRRKTAIENLQASFSDWSHEECEAVAYRVFRNFGRSTAEFLKAPSIDKAALEKLVVVDRVDYFDQALSHKKGVILVTAHMGNWELLARYVTQVVGRRLCVVARDADDRGTTDIVNELRKKSGYEVLSRGNAARGLLKALKANDLVAILPDQNAGDVFVPFFGRPCGSVVGPAVLHLKTGAPILAAFSMRMPDGRFKVEVRPPIVHPPTDDHDADVYAIMSRVQGEIEQQVRRYPDQWLWLHDRWRSARRRSEEPAHAG